MELPVAVSIWSTERVNSNRFSQYGMTALTYPTYVMPSTLRQYSGYTETIFEL
jgi:hypothetical protein